MAGQVARQSAFGTGFWHLTWKARIGRKQIRSPGDRHRPVRVSIPAENGQGNEKPPVRIFVGSETMQFRAERVFVWSVVQARNPERRYDIYVMRNLQGYDRKRWVTGFSNYRYAIPYYCSLKGRAIYNDVDQVYLADPAELFDADMEGNALLAINDQDTSVMLMDCEKLAGLWSLVSAQNVVSHKRHRAPVLSENLWGTMSPEWNARDFEYKAGVSKVLHYTTLYKQPWAPFPDLYSYKVNENAHVWHDLEESADRAKYTIFNKNNPSDAFKEISTNAKHNLDGIPKIFDSAPEVHIKHLKKLILDYELKHAIECGSRYLPSEIGKVKVRHIPLFSEESDGFWSNQTRTDAIISIDQLHHFSEEDIPWIIKECFSIASRLFYLGVKVTSGTRRSSEGEEGAGLPKEWWEGQLRLIGRQFPHVTAILATTTREAPARALFTYIGKGR